MAPAAPGVAVAAGEERYRRQLEQRVRGLLCGVVERIDLQIDEVSSLRSLRRQPSPTPWERKEQERAAWEQFREQQAQMRDESAHAAMPPPAEAPPKKGGKGRAKR